jgi:hypothetical protein
MNRVLVSLCFLLSACGEVVPIEGATDAGDGDQFDADVNNPADGDISDLCGGPSIAIEDIETCFLRSQCAFMVRCFPGFPDLAFCEANAFDFFRTLADGTGDGEDDGPPTKLFFDILKRADAAGVATFDGVRAYNCLRSVENGSCKDDSSNADCEYILTGDVPVGDPCDDDFECVPGAYCDGFEDSSCDTVKNCRMGLGVGQNCDTVRCLPELECVRDGAGGNNSTCEDGSAGSKCSDSRECNANMYCSANICSPDTSTGADCVSNFQCPGNDFCVNGSCGDVSQENALCDTENGLCTGNLYCAEDGTGGNTCKSLPGPLQSCGLGPNGATVTCDRADHFRGGPTIQCVPRIPSGAPCSGQAFGNCALGTFCDAELGATNPKCTLPQPDGADCNADKHCSSDFCGGDAASRCESYLACWE